MIRGGLRRPLAAVSLVALLAALLSALPARELRARAALLSRGGPPASSSSSFDPAYGAFLREVAAATDRNAPVAMVVPPGELYVYAAAYELAPRPVLFRDPIPRSAVVAVFGPRPPPPGGSRRRETLPHGLLVRP